jgi:hypothetical protein
MKCRKTREYVILQNEADLGRRAGRLARQSPESLTCGGKLSVGGVLGVSRAGLGMRDTKEEGLFCCRKFSLSPDQSIHP